MASFFLEPCSDWGLTIQRTFHEASRMEAAAVPAAAEKSARQADPI